MKQLLLSTNWQCKQRNAELALDADFHEPDGWFPASVPGSVHTDLLAAERIPDPFVGLNEAQVQWIGESDWLYLCRFSLPADYAVAQRIILCCDGLDTFATLWLNDVQILSSDNMFVPQRIDISSHLLLDQPNELRIYFASALRCGKEIESEYGQLPCWNGDPSRLYVRKAQYHYGWDWGPTLLTVGPWRAIRLEAYDARIEYLHCFPDVSADLLRATLPLAIHLESAASTLPANLILHVALLDSEGEAIQESRLAVTQTMLTHTFQLEMPRLWWPRGYGEPALYRLVVTLLSGEIELDHCEQSLGLRRLRLVQQPLHGEDGTSFYFEINNTPLFCGGANWIPADSFLSRVTPESYREWLRLAAEGNMLMLRVWGGGIYEEDIFYDLCDELGLLVWQDFMFACGIYPAHESFIASVMREAEANIVRLRHHPSLVLWCGNNEDYLIAASQLAYDPDYSGDLTQSRLPARLIYEQLLPALCEELDPTRPYWPGSPYAGTNPNDLQQGDQHIWNIWHGTMEPYQDYHRFSGRFVSEFGMQSFPDLALIETFADPAELYAQSRTLDWHNKGSGGPKRIAAYLVDNFRLPSDFEGYIYVTQLLQAEALAAGIRSWRRRWAGPGREYSAGALIWQFNDCWPATSWAIVDYTLRPKPAYHVVRRELAPRVLGLARQGQECAVVWACNALDRILEAELELRIWTLDGELISEKRSAVTLAPNQATELGELDIVPDAEHVIAARLLQGTRVLARAALWPEPFKHLDMPDPAINVERLDEQTVCLQARCPAKGVWLTGGDGIRWSDNMLDLLPEDPQTVIGNGLDWDGPPISLCYYGQSS